MSTLWLLPLSVGGLGAVALGIAAHRLAGEVDALRRSLRPLRAARPDAGPSKEAAPLHSP
ncbi:MAG TPA: hypothetical protein VGL49_01875 [Acidimicrobiales bacterium]